ncbi:MAG: globin domain-containing protein [Fimbriimonas sp.]
MKSHVELVQTTFRAAVPEADRLSLIFYRRLFAMAPACRELFPEDMQLQRQKLVQALGFIVDNLAEPGAFSPQLRNMGIRHAAYGVQLEHYAVVRVALIESLAEIFGSAFDDSTRSAWTFAYDQIERVMLEGHALAVELA